MDTSQITDPAARALWEQFLRDRTINVEFYRRVPEDKLDFRMIDTPNRKSDSSRESIIHQIDTTRDYVRGVKTGTLQFRATYEDLRGEKKLTKDELLTKLEESEKEVMEVLADPEISKKPYECLGAKNLLLPFLLSGD